MAVYTKDGEWVRRIKPNEQRIFRIKRMTVSMEGHIAAIDGSPNPKVIVL